LKKITRLRFDYKVQDGVLAHTYDHEKCSVTFPFARMVDRGRYCPLPFLFCWFQENYEMITLSMRKLVGVKS